MVDAVARTLGEIYHLTLQGVKTKQICEEGNEYHRQSRMKDQ